MKIFNTVQELWDHCTFCRICGKNRDITVSVGPDDKFELFSFEKSNEYLDLFCHYNKRRNDGSTQIHFKINCLNNFCDIQGQNFYAMHPTILKKIENSYFYFYIQSSCEDCELGTTSSLDLEIDETQHVVNIGLERESYFVLKESDKFHITIYYDQDIMYVSRCYIDEYFNLIEEIKSIKLPLVNLDFSNQHRVIEKIKTLILFS